MKKLISIVITITTLLGCNCVCFAMDPNYNRFVFRVYNDFSSVEVNGQEMWLHTIFFKISKNGQEPMAVAAYNKFSNDMISEGCYHDSIVKPAGRGYSWVGSPMSSCEDGSFAWIFTSDGEYRLEVLFEDRTTKIIEFTGAEIISQPGTLFGADDLLIEIT